MRVAPAINNAVIEIIGRSSHRPVGKLYGSYKTLIKQVRGRVNNTYFPGFTAGIGAGTYYFAPNFYKIIGNTLGSQKISNNIYGIAFGTGAEIELYTRIFFTHIIIIEINQVKIGKLQQGVNNSRIGLYLMLRGSESGI